jgi:hypothetical protein
MPSRRSTDGLRLLDPRELALGKTLPGHVRDRAGRILIRKGQAFSLAHLQLLAERGSQAVYVDADWDGEPPPPVRAAPQFDPQELLEALKRKHGLRSGLMRGRRQQRYPWHCQLAMMIQECSDGVLHHREITVETCDVSSGGLAFISQQFLHIGTIIYPRFDSLPNRPVTKGIVRHCVHIEARRHRVGVELVPFDPGEQPPARRVSDLGQADLTSG